MGSIIALASAKRNGARPAGLVLSGPIGVAPHLADTVTALEEAVAAGRADHALDALGAVQRGFEPARTRYDWLSRDDAEVDAYVADPLSGDEMPLTVAYAAGVFALAVRAATAEAVAQLPDGLPVLLLSGELDPVGGEGRRPGDRTGPAVHRAGTSGPAARLPGGPARGLQRDQPGRGRRRSSLDWLEARTVR